jgi:hypothetical protein
MEILNRGIMNKKRLFLKFYQKKGERNLFSLMDFFDFATILRIFEKKLMECGFLSNIFEKENRSSKTTILSGEFYFCRNHWQAILNLFNNLFNNQLPMIYKK